MGTPGCIHAFSARQLFDLISLGFFPQCSVSCGSGSRERQVICSDPQRNLYPAVRCDADPKPSTAERCNGQSCSGSQGERRHHGPQTLSHIWIAVCASPGSIFK